MLARILKLRGQIMCMVDRYVSCVWAWLSVICVVVNHRAHVAILEQSNFRLLH